jgi:hypothetical protein
MGWIMDAILSGFGALIGVLKKRRRERRGSQEGT